MSLLLTRGFGAGSLAAIAIGGGIPEITSAISIDPDLSASGESIPRVAAENILPKIVPNQEALSKIHSSDLKPTLISLGEVD